MNERQKNSDRDVILSNLSLLLSRQEKDAGLRVCELAELARLHTEIILSLMEDGLAVDEALSIVRDGLHIENSYVNSHPVLDLTSNFTRSVTSFDKCKFAELIFEALKDSGVNVSLSDFLPDETTDNSVVYVKNALSDEAYEVFSQQLDNSRISYADNFRNACSLVRSGEAGYCILPIEEKGGERIVGISSMISEFDLKITAITPVFGFDGTADVKYALVCSGYHVPEALEGDDLYLELILGEGGLAGLSELFTTLDELNISLYRVTDEKDRASSRSRVLLVLSAASVRLSVLLTYLTLFVNNFSVRGIYLNLE